MVLAQPTGRDIIHQELHTYDNGLYIAVDCKGEVIFHS